MIEIVSFGEGFRLDGANWGVRARARIDRGWRALPPSKYKLDHYVGNSVLETTLDVRSDGTGRLVRLVSPEFQEKFKTAGQHSFYSVLAGVGLEFNEQRSFGFVVNVKISEIVEASSEQMALNALRLMYLVRHNPGGYPPPGQS